MDYRMKAVVGVLGIAIVAFCLSPAFAQLGPSSTSASGAIGAGNSSSNGNGSSPNSNKNSNANRASAIARSNSASQSAANSNQQQGQVVNYTQTTPSKETIYNVPQVYAPGLTAAGSEVCLGSISAGGAAAGIGLTLGGTIVDKECQLRMNARTLATLGYAVAAREEMCVDPEVRAAMIAAGTPCAADRGAPVMAYRADYSASTQSSAPVPAAGCYKTYQLLGGWQEVCN